jgi:hypothetical protein
MNPGGGIGPASRVFSVRSTSIQMNPKDQFLNFAWQETHTSRTLP